MKSFQKYQNFKHLKGVSSDSAFKYLTYNILANSLYVPKQTMLPEKDEFNDKAYRQRQLILDLKNLEADIVCLQEVEKDIYDELETEFSQKYNGQYLGKYAPKKDGIATFWNPGKFKLLNHTPVHLDESFASLGVTDDYKEDTTQLRNLGQILHFSTQTENRQIVVVNIHTQHNPFLDAVKYAQVAYLLKSTDVYTKQILEKNPQIQLSVLFSGDFNSRPESQVYQLLKYHNRPTQEIFNADSEVENIINSEIGKIWSATKTEQLPLYQKIHDNISDSFKNPNLNFQNAYSNYYTDDELKQNLESEEAQYYSLRQKYGDGNPRATNLTAGFQDTLDYIFFNNLDLLKIMKIDEEFYRSEGKVCTEETSFEKQNYFKGIPNSEHPSDHTPLMAMFEY